MSASIENVINLAYLVICVVGGSANLLVILVLLKNKQLRSSANLFTLNLAMADFFFLVRLPFLVVQEFKRNWPFGPVICVLYRSVTLSSHTASNFLLMLISLDRYIAVCYPLQINSYRRKSLTKLLCTVCWILAALFRVPSMVYSKSISYTNKTTNETRTRCRTDWPDSIRVPTFVLNSTIGYFVPCLIIAYVYTAVIITLRRSRRQNTSISQASGSSSNRWRKATNISAAIILAHILSWTPYWVVKSITLLDKGKDVWAGFNVIHKISLVAAFLHSASNPFLYMLIGTNFKLFWKSTIRKSRSGLSGQRVVPHGSSGQASDSRT